MYTHKKQVVNIIFKASSLNMRFVNKEYDNFAHILIFLPFFFSIEHGLYHFIPGENIHYGETRNLLEKPIPLSFYLSPLLFFYFVKYQSKIFVKYFFIIIFCLIIFLINFFYFNKNYVYLFYFLQIIYPTIGILIGYNSNKIFDQKFLKNFFLFFIIFQILSSIIISKEFFLLDTFYFFSIYQQYQYTTSIWVILVFIIILNKETNTNTLLKYTLLIVINLFTAMTLNFSTILICLIGNLLFAFSFFRNIRYVFLFFLMLILLIICIWYLSINQIGTPTMAGYKTENLLELFQLKVPLNIRQRLDIYESFFKLDFSIIEFFIGFKNINFLLNFKSGHNILIDYFLLIGIFPVLVIVFLFYYLGFLNYNNKENKYFFSVIFFMLAILIENMFKVSMKQPYPGLITFFIYGYFICHIKKV